MTSDLQLPEGVPQLGTYYMYITGGCNLACRHCWITPTFETNGGTGKCLDYGLYEIAIKEALPLGLRSVKFTGGEPLLHPDFIRMVDYATEQGLSSWVETNGTLVTSDMASHLRKTTSLSSVSVSLDGGTAASHDYMRNVPGSFERARRGIQYLVEAGFHPQIIMSLYPGNVNEIETLVRWAQEVGCGTVKFNLLQPSGRGKQMRGRGEWIEMAELIKIGKWVENELQHQVSIPLFYSWPLAFQGIGRFVNVLESCNLVHILGVLSTGQLAMCGIGTQEKDLIYGELGKDNVGEIWATHPALLQARDTVSHLEGICSNCIHKSVCIGNCIAQNYYATKRLTAPFWFCQMAEEEGLFPATRKIALDMKDA